LASQDTRVGPKGEVGQIATLGDYERSLCYYARGSRIGYPKGNRLTKLKSPWELVHFDVDFGRIFYENGSKIPVLIEVRVGRSADRYTYGTDTPSASGTGASFKSISMAPSLSGSRPILPVTKRAWHWVRLSRRASYHRPRPEQEGAYPPCDRSSGWCLLGCMLGCRCILLERHQRR